MNGMASSTAVCGLVLLLVLSFSGMRTVHAWSPRTIIRQTSTRMIGNSAIGSASTSWPSTATRLQATNSRELRFYNSGPASSTSSSTQTNNNNWKDNNQRGVTTSSSSSSSSSSMVASFWDAAERAAIAGTNQNNNNNNNSKNDQKEDESNPWLFQQATQSWSSAPLALWEALIWAKAATTEENNSAAGAPLRTTHAASSSSSPSPRGTTTTTTTTVNLGPGLGTTTAIFRSFSNGPPYYGSNGDNKDEDNNKTINNNNKSPNQPNTTGKIRPVMQGYGSSIVLTPEEKQLFDLLRRVRQDTALDTTLRVAGGWVRDKLLATPEFHTYHAIFEVAGKRLTSKFRAKNGIPASPQASLGRLGTKILTASEDAVKPVDIDIALDDMLGREFAEQLNDYLSSVGEETHSVGVVLKNPEKSKHLETATMKVGSFWIDFVNLRAEEYTQDSRIPDLMRIGTAEEDAMRRDLTINALFYNINTGEVEDWTGRGFEDLRRGIVATPLPPLTTLLDDPLRVLRSVRFAARLRFTIDQDLQTAAKDVRVRTALAQKVSRERVGGEVELMLRSPDPVGAMRLLLQLELIETVFPSMTRFHGEQGLSLLSTAHDHLADCRWSPPIWCQKISANGGRRLVEDEEGRRLLWYTSFLKPLWDFYQQQEASEEKLSVRQSKKQKRKNSPVKRLLVDDLKRPSRDAESIEKILKAADEISDLVKGGGVVSGTMILLSDINVREDANPTAPDQPNLVPYMCGRKVEPTMEDDPVWAHAMDYRLACSQMLQRIGPLWRAALILALSEELNTLQACEDTVDYCIEGDFVDESQEERRRGIIEKYDIFAASLLRLGLIGSWDLKPLLDGGEVKRILPRIPKGPAFRTVMDEQSEWMARHPGASADDAKLHLQLKFPDFAAEEV